MPFQAVLQNFFAILCGLCGKNLKTATDAQRSQRVVKNNCIQHLYSWPLNYADQIIVAAWLMRAVWFLARSLELQAGSFRQ